MSLSEDEDEFQSADEEGFGEEVTEAKEVVADVAAPQHTHKSKENAKDLIKNSPPIAHVKQENLANEDIDDDEEEALAERIRERNLRIARKFSAEIAKNIKTSAPIPVKTPLSGNRHQLSKDEGGSLDDIEYPSSNPPPAPPPTPALSSSFSNSQEPTVSPVVASELKEENENVGSKYGWRIPTKNTPSFKQPESASTFGASVATTSNVSDKRSKNDQARSALDRLTSLTQDNKNLFEKVAEDLKKVSIKSNPVQTSESSSSGANIPIISDLGALGGWSWNSASRLLASASQVTSQVGSMLDTVKNASSSIQQQSKEEDKLQASNSKLSSVRGQQESDVINQEGKKKSEDEKCESKDRQQAHPVSMSAGEAMSNDALVDFTLNAMESLGKKAFGVMTERNESGSLQIKGLGRPWEHLLHSKKGQAPVVEQQVHPDHSDTPEDLLGVRDSCDAELCSTVVTSHEKTKKTSEGEQTSLKNRRRRYIDDNDRLD